VQALWQRGRGAQVGPAASSVFHRALKMLLG